MDRRERSEFLERLVVLRRLYRQRSSYDSEPILSIAAALAAVERLAQHGDRAAPRPM